MLYYAENNHPTFRCPRCGCPWFRVTGVTRVTLHYDAESRAFLDDVLVDDSSRLSPTDIECMDCSYDCATLVGDTFGPKCAPIRAASNSSKGEDTA